jgi:GAF domain-containing protein
MCTRFRATLPVTNSEIVVPVFDANRKLAAVLDVDSALPDAFDEEDRLGLERICAKLLIG